MLVSILQYLIPFQGDKDHPICPVWLGDARLANTMAEKMFSKYNDKYRKRPEYSSVGKCLGS